MRTLEVEDLPKAIEPALLAAKVNRPGFAGGSNPWEIGAMARAKQYSAEVRERAVRLVQEHAHEYESEWAAIQSVAQKIGCSAETLRGWIRQREQNEGRRPGLTSQERERLKDLERENRELRRGGSEDDKDEDYYPQFAQALRAEAARMSEHYEVFYCLEAGIRHLIAETLEGTHGATWWQTAVPKNVQDNAKANIQRELDSGVTLRSEYDIDYTTFGELGEIVRTNWITFDAIFSSQKAFTKIMTSLNMLRAPIAHCSPLAEDEVLRLRLAVRDWFRLME